MTRYDFCSQCDNDNGFSIVAKDGKYGIFNFFENKEIVKPIYDGVDVLDENFFAIKTADGWGVLSHDNETILPTIYYEVINHSEDYLLAFRSNNGFMLVSKKDSKQSSKYYSIIHGFDHGFAVVAKDSCLGVIDQNLKEVIYPQYTNIEYFKDDLFFVTKDGKISIVDSNNNHILALNYESITRFGNTEYFLVCKGGVYGVLDNLLRWVVPLAYSHISHAFDDYCIVTSVSGTNLKGVFKIRGDFTISPIYKNIYYLGDGLFRVSDNSGEYALFDANGNKLTDFIYYHLNLKGTAITCAVIAKDNPDELTFGLLSTEGNVLIEPIYDAVQGRGVGYVVCKDDKYGICDSKFNLVSDIIFDNVYNIVEEAKIGHKIALVSYNGMKGSFFW